MGVLRSFLMLVILAKLNFLFVRNLNFLDIPVVSSQVCYSWWVLSSLIMIDRVHWIDKEKLAKFILDCQVKSAFDQLFQLNLSQRSTLSSTYKSYLPL